MLTWIREHPVLLAWLGGISVVTFLIGTVLLPLLVVRMRSDHFVRPDTTPEGDDTRHPLLRLLVRLGRNLLGVCLILAGLAMLVLPGQGILTILLGVAFLDVPGKRRVELWVLRRAPVRRSIDWLRRRAGRPPLELPPP